MAVLGEIDGQLVIMISTKFPAVWSGDAAWSRLVDPEIVDVRLLPCLVSAVGSDLSAAAEVFVAHGAGLLLIPSVLGW